ncbi:MAG: hypothetical protein ACR2J8_05420, partial [Thermomicrobiales bacterium]
MGEIDWPARYVDVLGRAEAAAARCRAEGRSIACGFTGNVDRVVALDEPLLARLVAGRSLATSGGRVVHARTVDDLLT